MKRNGVQEEKMGRNGKEEKQMGRKIIKGDQMRKIWCQIGANEEQW